ncbi:hypothetical protein BJV78DRAFT_1151873 [Lactifluus subvellereus]|nr:hypothetical protein BJV78DRAFT_1151873 [Lactifluus subvellereus]
MSAALQRLPITLPSNHDVGPQSDDYYKRAMYHAPPRRFEVDCLPPTKFGKAYCFGLRIYPILGDNISTKSGGTNSVYDIWRRWDDCLWFQDMLEFRYGFISREKRQRLLAGKGVKKNGMYIHDRASSFESLPPGPDPKSVAKDIHQYLPKLTKRGTFFRATQATVDQRGREFSALIKAFFKGDVPSLLRELREDEVIRNFFGYWRRDHDLAVKTNGKPPKTALDNDSTGGSSLFSYFSSSNTSLPLSHTHFPPVSPSSTHRSRSSSSRQRPYTPDSTTSLSDIQSTFAGSQRIFPAQDAPSSAPACMDTTYRGGTASEDGHYTDGRKTSTSSSNSSGLSPSSPMSSSHTATSRPRAKSHGAKSSPSSRTERFNITSDFPLFLSSSTRDLLPSSRPVPHSPTCATPGLGTLPEDTELGSPVTILPPPIPRNRKHSPVRVDPANRRCMVWRDVDEVSSSEGDILEFLTPVEGTGPNVMVAKSTSSSSLLSSIALSNLSLNSCPSSSRTSSDLARPCSAGSAMESDSPRVSDTDLFPNSKLPISPPTSIKDSSTDHPSLSGRHPWSLSQPQLVAAPVPTDVGDDDWSPDLGEDFIETYFGGPEPFFAPSEDDPLAYHDAVPDDLPFDVPEDPPDSPSVISFSSHRQEVPVTYIGGPAGAFHLPWMAPSLSKLPSQQTAAKAAAVPVVPSRPVNEALVVKAVLDDAIVIFRAHRNIALAELHKRLHDKFAHTGGISLRGAFALAYVPPTSGAGAKRMSTMSSASMGSVDWSRALPLRNEEEWATAAASCGSKITLRVSYPASR